MKTRIFWALVAVVGIGAITAIVFLAIENFKENNPLGDTGKEIEKMVTPIVGIKDVVAEVEKELSATPAPTDAVTPTPTPGVSLEYGVLKDLPRYDGKYAMEYDCNLGYRYCDLRYWQMKEVDGYEGWHRTSIGFYVGLLGIAPAEKAPDPDTGEEETACWIFYHAFPEYHTRDNMDLFTLYFPSAPESVTDTVRGIVFFSNNLTVQEWLLANGLAIANPEPGSEAFDAYFASLEAKAKEEKVGVWKDGYQTTFAGVGGE